MIYNRNFIPVLIMTLCVFIGCGLFFYERDQQIEKINQIYKANSKELASNISFPLKIKDVASINRIVSSSILGQNSSYLRVVTNDKLVLYEQGSGCSNNATVKAFVKYNNLNIGFVETCEGFYVSIENKTSFFLSIIGFIITTFFGLSIYLLMQKKNQPISDFILQIDKMSLDELGFPESPLHGHSEESVLKLYSKMSSLIGKIKDYQKTILNHEKNNLLIKVARQVSHDIRSPISSLKLLTRDIDDLGNDKKRIVKKSIQRIQEVANNLLAENENSNKLKVEMLLLCIEDVVSEIQTRNSGKLNIKISKKSKKSFNLFSNIVSSDFQNLISNLINNSIDAIDKSSGEIIISLIRGNDGMNEIEILDNGKGIPVEIIKKLGFEGVSFGKEVNESSGFGLGLYYCKRNIEAWGGSFNIESTLGTGTRVTLKIPSAETPGWIVQDLNFVEGQVVLIMSKDETDRELWLSKLKSIDSKKNPFEVLEITCFEVLEEWLNKKESKLKTTSFIFDEEMIDFDVDPLDLISKYGLEKSSILISNNCNEVPLYDESIKGCVNILPRLFIKRVPVKLVKDVSLSTLNVLIDNDSLIRLTWAIDAKKKDFKLVTFKSFEDLKRDIFSFSLNTRFYVDHNLGDGEANGEEVATYLYDKGFRDIFLATGYDSSDFKNNTQIKGVVGKDSPFS